MSAALGRVFLRLVLCLPVVAVVTLEDIPPTFQTVQIATRWDVKEHDCVQSVDICDSVGVACCSPGSKQPTAPPCN
jgi:hypothetical protein